MRFLVVISWWHPGAALMLAGALLFLTDPGRSDQFGWGRVGGPQTWLGWLLFVFGGAMILGGFLARWLGNAH